MNPEPRLSSGDLVERLTRFRDRLVAEGRLRSAAEVQRAIARERAAPVNG